MIDWKTRLLRLPARDVILVYFNPVLTDVVEAASNLRVYARSNYFGSPYIVYRSAV